MKVKILTITLSTRAVPTIKSRCHADHGVALNFIENKNMESLYRISNKPVSIFTIIYITSIISYVVLRNSGFSFAQAFNANVIGFLALIFMWMIVLLRYIDENKRCNINIKMMKSFILILQLTSYSIAIMITPSILEHRLLL